MNRRRGTVSFVHARFKLTCVAEAVCSVMRTLAWRLRSSSKRASACTAHSLGRCVEEVLDRERRFAISSAIILWRTSQHQAGWVLVQHWDLSLVMGEVFVGNAPLRARKWFGEMRLKEVAWLKGQ